MESAGGLTASPRAEWDPRAARARLRVRRPGTLGCAIGWGCTMSGHCSSQTSAGNSEGVGPKNGRRGWSSASQGCRNEPPGELIRWRQAQVVYRKRGTRLLLLPGTVRAPRTAGIATSHVIKIGRVVSSAGPGVGNGGRPRSMLAPASGRDLLPVLACPVFAGRGAAMPHMPR